MVSLPHRRRARAPDSMMTSRRALRQRCEGLWSLLTVDDAARERNAVRIGCFQTLVETWNENVTYDLDILASMIERLAIDADDMDNDAIVRMTHRTIAWAAATQAALTMRHHGVDGDDPAALVRTLSSTGTLNAYDADNDTTFMHRPIARRPRSSRKRKGARPKPMTPIQRSPLHQRRKRHASDAGTRPVGGGFQRSERSAFISASHVAPPVS